MASEDDGYDYDDGVAYDYDDNDVYDYDDEYVYEGNDDGDYGIDIVGNDENLSEDIASNQGSHGDYRDPNDDDDDDDDHDHDVVVDSDSDDSGVIAFDSCYDLGDISQQMEKMYFEHNGALNENPGGAGVGPVLKSESLGSITNNTAEYKAVSQGASTDLHMGYGSIHVHWNSQLLTPPQGADHGDYYDHDPHYDYDYNNIVDNELCDDMYITQEMTDSSSDLEDITQQMEKVHLECDGASNGNFGRASKGTALKYEMGIMSEKVYLEFDGASKGNPGRAGAGALLKSEDGTVITRVREGLGEGTNNDAEYRSLIQGLKTALDMGYDRIHAKGDSQLVVKQVKGEWQTRNDKMAEYRDEARKLSYQFKEFEISHIPRYLSDHVLATDNHVIGEFLSPPWSTDGINLLLHLSFLLPPLSLIISIILLLSNLKPLLFSLHLLLF